MDSPTDIRSLLEAAFTALGRGDLTQAERLASAALAASPREFDALHVLAVLRAQARNLPAALVLLDRALACKPRAAEAWKNRAAVLQGLGRADEALASAERAVRYEPGLAEAWLNRGIAERALGRREAAAGSLERAIHLEPRLVAAWTELASLRHEARRYAAALEAWRAAQAIVPDDATAWSGSAATLIALARFEDGLAAATRACVLVPERPEPWLAAGVCQRRLGELGAARDSIGRALALRGDDAAAWNGLGNVQLDLRDFGAALESYGKALELAPATPEYLCNRGLARLAAEDRSAAMEDLGAALALAPDYVPALEQRGSARLLAGDAVGAVADLERARALEPQRPFVASLLARARAELCDWRERARDCAALRDAADEGRAENPLVAFALLDEPALHLTAARAYARERRLDRPGRRVAPEQTLPERSGRRLRLGYISADFREHPVAMLSAGLFSDHDRARFSVVGFSLAAGDGSALRRRLEGAFDEFVDLTGCGDEEAARTIASRQIDIAIDLSGYTTGARPGIFRFRPAPVQIAFLGYPGTLGIPHMDYLVADRFAISRATQQHYAERILYLPHCLLPNDPARERPGPRPERAAFGLPPDGLVLGSFAASYKLAPELFDIWIRVLTMRPDALLWLGIGEERARQNLRAEAARRGLDPARLVFAGRVPSPAAHLARLQLADLQLDTLPYNGHSTVCDALWAGVPVLSCAGASFPARIAGSALRAHGLAELVADDPADYERRLLALTDDRSRLDALRVRTEANRLTHPLFDAARHRRALETGFELAWNRFVCGEPPVTLDAPDPGQDPVAASSDT